MDWQIKPLAKESAVSGNSFSVGDRIVCFLFLNDEAEIERADVKEEEREKYPRPESILGCWGRVVKDQKDEEREARQQVLASSEELFLSLYQEGTIASEERESLKQVIGLMLERKRIIRATPERGEGYQVFRHVKNKQFYNVPNGDISPQQLLKIQETLGTLVL